MCLLTFLPPDVQPDLSALINGAAVNDDGHGFAVVTHGRLLVQHGMHAEAMIAAFAAARRAHPQGPALFHSRLGTHGARTVANCHPFPVGGDDRTVIAHNGVLPAAVQPVPPPSPCSAPSSTTATRSAPSESRQSCDPSTSNLCSSITAP